MIKLKSSKSIGEYVEGAAAEAGRKEEAGREAAQRTDRGEGMEKILTDYEKAEAIWHSGHPYEVRRSGIIALMDATKEAELKKQLAERLQNDEMLLQNYALDSEGYIYTVMLNKNENPSDIYGYFSDSDLAYFSGVKTGCQFKIEKHRIAGYAGVNEEEPILAKPISGELVSGEDYGAAAVITLTFDETGELLCFQSYGKDYDNQKECVFAGDGAGK